MEFELTTPIEVQENGKEHVFNFIEIKEPTGRCRTACFQVQAIFEKAKIDLGLISLQMAGDNRPSSEEIAEAEEKEETAEEKIENALSVLNSGGADKDALFNALIQVLIFTGKFNGEHDCKKAHFEDMSIKDTDKLIGYYLANFM